MNKKKTIDKILGRFSYLYTQTNIKMTLTDKFIIIIIIIINVHNEYTNCCPHNELPGENNNNNYYYYYLAATKKKENKKLTKQQK